MITDKKYIVIENITGLYMEFKSVKNSMLL